MSPFSFLILLISMLSRCPLVRLAKGLSILFIFLKSQLPLWLILWIVLFVSTWFISALILTISYCLLLLGEFASFDSRAFRCTVRLLAYALSSFFLAVLRDMRFPLRNAFIVFYKIGYVVASFSLNYEKSLISLFLPWPRYHWVECYSASMWMLAFYSLCCYWRSTLVCGGDLIRCMGQFQYLSFCWGCFMSNYMVNLRRYIEVLRRSISFCFRIKCSVDIC
jgi:hypothetical protein